MADKLLFDIWRSLVVNLYLDVLYTLLTYNGSITSAIRSRKRNTEKKGFPTSWHLDALAVDVMLDDENSKDGFRDELEVKKYRVLPIKNTQGRGFHVQYDFPIIQDYERLGQLTHLREVMKRIFKD